MFVVETLAYADSEENGKVLVTVVMPIYNAGAYLRLAVLSIVEQSFVHWELLIIDDGSTDDALDSIADIEDIRIQILRDGKNLGLAARLNQACEMARGRYIARMDQDDVSYPERLMTQFEVLENNPDIDVLATRAVFIDERNCLAGVFPYAGKHGEISARPWFGFYFPHPTWMSKTTWLRRFRYAVPAPFLSEDYELLLRSYQYSQFKTVDTILLAYRKRAHVNHWKVAKTRAAVLRSQLHFFSKQKKLRYAALSLIAFCIKKLGDLFRCFGFLKTAAPAPATVADKWADTLAKLLAKGDVKSV